MSHPGGIFFLVRGVELPSKDDWLLLGVDPSEPMSSAKRKYRQAARASHPDLASGDAERFRRVGDAWRRIEASLAWRDAQGFASAASVDYEDEGFDEAFGEGFAPDVDDYSNATFSAESGLTAPLCERFVRRLGRAVFLSGRFPEGEWSAVVALAAGSLLALLVRSGVQPAGLSGLLDALIAVVVVGRIVSLPARLRR